ncbi:MAG: hypothetical protein IT377_33300 [Polyangiaceae bacterium]|nr:hypothetical protein [Polyangiaceae bacterium]
MARRSAWLFISLSAALAQACSSGSGNSSGTGYTPNPALCQATCSSAAKAGCNTGSPTECEADCEKTREQYSECLAETDALFSCGTANGYVCGPGGTSFNGCEAETKSLSLCGACIPTGSNGPCTICSKKACCAQYKAFGQAPDLASYTSCVGNCSTLDCLTACENASPVAGKAFKDVDACRTSACPSACDGQPSDLASDPVGRLCAAQKSAGCPQPDCESTYSQIKSESNGCGPEMYAAIECAGSKPVTCKNGTPVLDEACLQGYMDCIGVGGGGGQGGGGGAVVVGGAGGASSGGSGGAIVGGSGGAIVGGSGGADGG